MRILMGGPLYVSGSQAIGAGSAARCCVLITRVGTRNQVPNADALIALGRVLQASQLERVGSYLAGDCLLLARDALDAGHHLGALAVERRAAFDRI